MKFIAKEEHPIQKEWMLTIATSIPKSYGDRFNELRKKKHLNVAQLARQMIMHCLDNQGESEEKKT